jgi:hypothetical protein
MVTHTVPSIQSFILKFGTERKLSQLEMKGLKIFLAILLLIVISSFLYYRFSGRKCYIELPDKVIIINIDKIENLPFRFSTADISILSATSKYSLFPKILITGKTHENLFDVEGNFCAFDEPPNIQKTKTQLLLFHEFYSSNSGESFVNIETYSNIIKKEFQENGRCVYSKIKGDSLILYFTASNYLEGDKDFVSRDGGKSWSR